MKYKRKYVCILCEYHNIDSKNCIYSVKDYIIAFNKNELRIKIQDAIQSKINNEISLDNITIDIFEFASERYIYKFPFGFINKFNALTKSNDEYLYDKLLQIIDCNYFGYEYLDNEFKLVCSHVNEFKYDNGVRFNMDTPLYENDCVNGYKSNFGYFYYSKINDNENDEYYIIKDNYMYNIYFKNYIDGIIHSDIGVCDNIEDCINCMKMEVLSASQKDFFPNIENVDNFKLFNMSLNYSNINIEIVKVLDDRYEIIFKSNDIKSIFKEFN